VRRWWGLAVLKPLLPHPRYDVSAKVKIGKKARSISWSFTTA